MRRETGITERATFGDSQDLYATLFVGEKAFAVTYMRVDPFHAFEVTAEGEIHEMSEFVVSGWNDFFRSVSGGERLVGIGVNDEGGSRTLAVSLYDISDLTNSDPLIDRDEVQADYSWSEANWDHRAFSVIEFDDFIPSTLKTAVFGLIIGTIACYLGFTTTQGTEGVGRASTRSVVIASIAIIVVNVVLVKLIFFFFPENA